MCASVTDSQPNYQLQVTILTTSFPRFDGDSSGIFVCNYAEQLARSNCRVNVIAPHDQSVDSGNRVSDYRVNHFKYFLPIHCQSLAYKGGLLARLRKNRWRFLQLPFFLISFFLHGIRSARKSNLLHSYWSLAGLIAILIKAVKGIPVVLTLWGSDIFFMENPWAAFIFRRIVCRADAIVCENNQFRMALEKLGVPGDLITVIPNGIDLQKFQPREKETARNQLNLGAGKLVILTIGNLNIHKGQQYLIDAIPEILRTNSDIEFYFVGDGENRPQLEAQVKKLDLNQHVTFAGFQETSIIPVWLNAADIFVLPSLSEGSPNAVLEAMACGLPVVATTTGNLSQMIRHEIDGLLVSPSSSDELAKTLASLCGDQLLRKRLAQTARETILAQYGNWKNQAESLLQVYQSVVPGTRTFVPNHHCAKGE